VREDLMRDGVVLRYLTHSDLDNLPPGEGAFLPCTFWLANCLALTGRREEAEALFENLLALRNDVGLLSEEFDPRARRMLGNFPQALSHMALINTAHLLALPPEKTERSAAVHERLGTAARTASWMSAGARSGSSGAGSG